MVIVSLIGEQPIPNLLPIRHQPPSVVVLVYTDRTQKAAERLEQLLPDGCEAVPCHVSAYDIPEIVSTLNTLITDREWSPAGLLFNLTGGTKAMALAAYLAAAERRAPFLYLQSEGRQTRLYRYEFDAERIPCVSSNSLLPSLITIDDYIRAYVGDYRITGFSETTGGLFERAVYEALDPVVGEVVAGIRLGQALEIDMVVRCENQVGIIEAKTRGRARRKEGIDQLNTAGGRAYLGIYTRKMLVIDQNWGKNQSALKDLAEARRIEVIELPSYRKANCLSPEDVQHLQCAVCRQLGKDLPEV